MHPNMEGDEAVDQRETKQSGSGPGDTTTHFATSPKHEQKRAGPYTVIASNFAPRTTSGDIETVMGPHAGVVHSCRLLTSTPTVIAELVLDTKEGADNIVATFNNRKADGRLLYVYVETTPTPNAKQAARRETNEPRISESTSAAPSSSTQGMNMVDKINNLLARPARGIDSGSENPTDVTASTGPDHGSTTGAASSLSHHSEQRTRKSHGGYGKCTCVYCRCKFCANPDLFIRCDDEADCPICKNMNKLINEFNEVWKGEIIEITRKNDEETEKLQKNHLKVVSPSALSHPRQYDQRGMKLQDAVQEVHDQKNEEIVRLTEELTARLSTEEKDLREEAELEELQGTLSDLDWELQAILQENKDKELDLEMEQKNLKKKLENQIRPDIPFLKVKKPRNRSKKR
ncbi:hypothetical protein BDV95DRAFT_660084 [Massariosphaeria phaeospora]|uniref:RRM domain-containing protein n=1 Tax=Massariosphaeria phaeospora TaxID=100035 RepID=A0A7C8MD88_9PLEO|nr:hypothetical protein BDV95DRAFT_660084 [Massariosphaeria phaeospora]